MSNLELFHTVPNTRLDTRLDLRGLPVGTKVFIEKPETPVTLVLSRGEAASLRSVLERIGGSPENTARGNIQDIEGKLHALGVGLHPQDDEGDFVDRDRSSNGVIYIIGKRL